MKTKYPRASELKLLFTDTDSLAFAIQTDSIYEDMAVDADSKYDFSEYPKDHPSYSISNKKAFGYFKDELNSVPMEEFVGLRPKCYAFTCTGRKGRKKYPPTFQTSREKKQPNASKRFHQMISSTSHTVRSVHQ